MRFSSLMMRKKSKVFFKVFITICSFIPNFSDAKEAPVKLPIDKSVVESGTDNTVSVDIHHHDAQARNQSEEENEDEVRYR